MTALTNLSPAASYGDLITCTNNGQGLPASALSAIQDGLGNNSPLQMSQTAININGTLQVTGVPLATITSTTMTLTNANIVAMYGAPVPVTGMGTLGAGLAYVIYGFSINGIAGVAAFTGGGPISLTYGSNPHAAQGVATNTISATAFTSATSTFSYATGSGTVVSGTQAYATSPIYISNSGATFVGGVGTGSGSLTVYYSIVSVT